MLAMKAKTVFTFFLTAIQAAYSAEGPEDPPPPSPLCVVLTEALSTHPSYQNSPSHAVESNQVCTVSDGAKTWRCELLFRDSCNNVIRGSSDDPGKVFSAALRTAEECFPDRVRRNTELVENNSELRRRILRDAHFGYPEERMPTLTVSADAIQYLGKDRQCETINIELRFEEAPLPPARSLH
ncbi:MULTISPECIES: hypothetical protein [Aeromonas]|nr:MULTISPECIES: hypothetical protein [Aeromonas]EHA1068550.1 hypothetical protein [Aeromonas hydrophila]MBM0437696.1 hypothetical protein [Aeromonas hydrophila subsp. ranae]MBW3829123.1 hypothetical protein [Aeromonas hydrophila]MCX4115721.1 hypothetical protein [Aeromonas hydrophila]MDD9232263.1 hypothetical protein [Aeromonas hydrophila]